MTDLSEELQMAAIEKIIFLRAKMGEALGCLDEGDLAAARHVLQETLAASDVGEMKVWQAGEEPF